MEKTDLWMLGAALAVIYLTAVTINAVKKRRHRHATGGAPLPPGPTPLPLVGNLLSLGGIFHQTLASLARVHGPVMTLRLGLTTTVVVSSAAAAREAYTKHDARLAARPVPDAFRANGFSSRSIVFTPSADPQWKTLRGINATHIFSPRGLAAVRAIRERKVAEMVGYIRRHAAGAAGEAIHVRDVVHGGMLNLMSSSMFSMDMAEVGSESAHGLRELVEDIVNRVSRPNVSDFVPFLRRLDLQGLRRQTGHRLSIAFALLDDIVVRRMDAASRQGSSTTDTDDDDKRVRDGDYLDTLIRLMSDGKITRHHVTHMLFDAFAAGADTMTSTVEWVMASLLHHPRVMTKVREELDDVLGGKEGAVEEADAARLTYLQCVCKEVMRLHPVGPILIPHLAAQDGVEIGGYGVPRGARVVFNAWAIMRDPAAWERPDEFLPERFLPPPHGKSSSSSAAAAAAAMDFRGKDFGFIPFGSGRRLCPGLPLVERVVPFTLASLLHAFEWRLPDGVSPEKMDLTERFTTINVLATPLKAVPIVIR